MLAPEWTWAGFAPVWLAAALLLFAPGAALGLALRVPRHLAVALAPLVTTTLIAVAGLAFGAARLPWTAVTAGALLGAVTAASGVVLLVAARRGAARPPLDRRGALHWAGAVAASCAAITWVLVGAAGAPGNFPQNPDMVYHLGLTRWFVENGTVSSLQTRLGDLGVAAFYPAALHGVAATLCLLAGVPAIIGLTAVQFVVVGLVWPVGLLALVRAVASWTPRTLWLAAPVAAAFPIFPYRLVGYGPLWPLDASYAALPAWLALVVWATGPGLPIRRRLVAWGAAGASAVGLLLLHLAALFTAAAPVWFLLLARVFAPGWGATRTRRVAARAAVAASLPLAWAAAWRVAPAGMVANSDKQAVGWERALVAASRLWGDGTVWTWRAEGALLALILIGAAVAARRSWWLAASVAVLSPLPILLDAVGTAAAPWLTWPWYNVAERLRAAVIVLAAPLAVAGLARLAGLGGRRVSRALFVGCLALATAAAWFGMAASRVTLTNYYAGRAKTPWLTQQGAEALRAISALLPDDAVVIANPWNGATYLSALGPEHVLIPSEKAAEPDFALLGAELDHAAGDPRVCSILERDKAFYLIVGGTPAMTTGRGTYPAFERAAQAPGFALLYAGGPYRLYRITACA